MRAVALVTMLALIAAPLHAGPRERITDSDATLCDTERRVCVRGSITYYSNPRLLELRSRVLRASGPGLLTFRFVGENLDGHTRRTTLDVQIRGSYSEIVNAKLITDHPDVGAWELEAIDFKPGAPPTSNNRQ